MMLASLRLACCAALFMGAAHAQTEPRFATDDIQKGNALFHRTCAQCHGRNMVNSGTTTYDLRRFPVDQPDRFVQSVTNGKGNMPSFKEVFSSEEIDKLWAYVGLRGGKEP